MYESYTVVLMIFFLALQIHVATLLARKTAMRNVSWLGMGLYIWSSVRSKSVECFFYYKGIPLFSWRFVFWGQWFSQVKSVLENILTSPEQGYHQLFKRQPPKIVKHTQTICRLLIMNCLNVFDHFVGLALKGLKLWAPKIKSVRKI